MDAVFDNIGGATVRRSWDLLAPHGTLVSYAIAAAINSSKAMERHFVALLARITWWNALPNGRRATFYNVWGGSRVRPARFRARLHQDLTAVLNLLNDGVLTAQIAARLPLAEVSRAMQMAEARTIPGKVILTP